MDSTASQTNLYFDQDITLRELLKAVSQERLVNILDVLLGQPWRMLNPEGETILGARVMPPSGVERAPFRLELEPIGYLESVRCENIGPAVALMEMFMLSASRYFMSAAIQMESVQQDYAELQEKNTLLQASEERYRDLAASLEQRVAEQVQIIETTQRQLYQAEKLASVGQLAAGVAHEINNPLGFIHSNLSTAGDYVARLVRFGGLMRLGRDSKSLADAWRQEQLETVLEDFPILLQESKEGVTRVAKIISALKDFSSIENTGETGTDINNLIQNTCVIAASEFGARIRLDTDFGVLPALRCDAGRLSQVLMNLLLNAVQAITEDGVVRIATSSDGQTVRVVIADSGRGIAPDVLERIFDPFFTTRDVGQGTGLGLSVARDVVRAHGGRIEVDSKVGAGTTFTITLPVTSHG